MFLGLKYKANQASGHQYFKWFTRVLMVRIKSYRKLFPLNNTSLLMDRMEIRWHEALAGEDSE